MQFKWRLQRLLDLKEKEEDVKRDELFALMEQTTTVRGRMLLEQAGYRRLLADLRYEQGDLRLARQQVFLGYAHVFDAGIRQLQERLGKLDELQRLKTAEILEIRKFRKSLEKLRQKANDQFVKQQQKIEQTQTDEYATLRFARQVIAQS